MNAIRHTNSLCPECYRELPALIKAEDGAAVMVKCCPDHGMFESLSERSLDFYTSINSGPTGIYPGYFVDVTRRCNLRCNYCYYALESGDPKGLYRIDNILTECAANIRHAPFVLTGGEPTMHIGIGNLIQRLGEIGPVEMLTNGVRLANREFFDELIPLLTRDNGNAAIHISIHPQSKEWIKVIGYLKEDGLVAGSVLIVVDSKEQFFNALEYVKRIGDLSLCFRIKAASRLWNEQKPDGTALGTGKIFVSDMLNWLKEAGETFEIIRDSGNKSVFVNVLWKGHWLMLVSWHDVGNVDLFDIACPPYYRARNGQVCNFVTACLINEGIDKGWCLGNRLESYHEPKGVTAA